jgi:hypothetical protein
MNKHSASTFGDGTDVTVSYAMLVGIDAAIFNLLMLLHTAGRVGV